MVLYLTTARVRASNGFVAVCVPHGRERERMFCLHRNSGVNIEIRLIHADRPVRPPLCRSSMDAAGANSELHGRCHGRV